MNVGDIGKFDVLIFKNLMDWLKTHIFFIQFYHKRRAAFLSRFYLYRPYPS